MAKDRKNIDPIWAEYKATGSVAARNRIVEEYLSFVRDIAGKIHKRLPELVDVDDLVSYGTFGLIDAIAAFEPERGLCFTTYASKRIFGAIIDGMRNADWVPRLSRKRTKLLSEAVATFEAEQGRPPTLDEARREMRLDQNEFRKIERDQARPMLSLSRPLREADAEHHRDYTELDHLYDRRERAPSHRLETDVADLVGIIVREFSISDALLIRLHFLEGWTLKQAGTAFGMLSETSMSIRKRQLLQKLRERFAPDMLTTLAGRAA